MHYHTCHRCKLIRKETTKSYHKRISISFSLPFICPACVRLIACVKHPDFAPYEVKPKVKKPKKPKVKSIEALGLHPRLDMIYKEYGKVSTSHIMMYEKANYEEALRILKLIEEYVGTTDSK